MVIHSLISTIGILTASFAGIVSSPKNVADTSTATKYSNPVGYVLDVDNFKTWFVSNYSILHNPDEDDDNITLMDFGNGSSFVICGNDCGDYDLSYYLFMANGSISGNSVALTYSLSMSSPVGVNVVDNTFKGYTFITDVIPTYYYNFGDYDVFVSSAIPGSELYDGQWLSSFYISPDVSSFASLLKTYPEYNSVAFCFTSALYPDISYWWSSLRIDNNTLFIPLGDSNTGKLLLSPITLTDFPKLYPYGLIVDFPYPVCFRDIHSFNFYPYISNPSNAYYDTLSARYFGVNGLYNYFICDDSSFNLTTSELHSLFSQHFPLNTSITNLGGVYKLLTFTDDDTYLYIDCSNYVNSDHSLVDSKDYYLRFKLNGVNHSIYHSEYLLTSQSWNNDVNFIDGSYCDTSCAFSLSIPNAIKALTCDSSVINIMATNGAYSPYVDDIYNNGYNEGYSAGYAVGNDSSSALSNVFGLLSKAFTSIGGFLSFEVLPNISVGLLLFIPVVVSLIIFVIKLIAGGGK